MINFTKLSRSAFALGTFVCALAACGPNPNPNGVTDMGSVSGAVIDAKTMQPLPNATVSVGTIVRNLSAGDGGRFTLMGVPIGQQTVTIRAIGYVTYSATVVVQKNVNSLVGDASGVVAMQPTI